MKNILKQWRKYSIQLLILIVGYIPVGLAEHYIGSTYNVGWFSGLFYMGVIQVASVISDAFMMKEVIVEGGGEEDIE